MFLCLLSYVFRYAQMGGQISLHVEGKPPSANSTVCKLHLYSFSSLISVEDPAWTILMLKILNSFPSLNGSHFACCFPIFIKHCIWGVAFLLLNFNCHQTLRNVTCCCICEIHLYSCLPNLNCRCYITIPSASPWWFIGDGYHPRGSSRDGC